MGDYLSAKNLGDQRIIPTPPPGPVRTMAEWEPIQALIITWAGQNTILREIVRNAVKECKVLIITENAVTVSTQLTNAGIPLDSVQFVDTPFNSIWVRDYGPWAVYQNDVDSLFLVDWIYNRPREDDDASPLAIAEHLQIPIYEATVDPHDLVHTGGNHLPDGMGTAFSSMLILEENPDKTEDEIDSIAKKYLGVKQYIKFPTLPFDGIHHLDMHMRIIDEETIIFGQYPDGVADGPQINSNIDYLLSEFQTSFGNKYRIIRMPMPPENSRYPDQGGDYRTYTNSIFINKTILVPTYEERYDTTALRIYRENLPGYNVVGINCNSIIPSLGALHCITKLVGVSEPLMIAHPRLRDSYDESKEYAVTAIIKHKSGISGADLYYRAGGDSIYVNVPMTLNDTAQNIWSAVIPPHAADTEIQYFIKARAINGKEQVRPIVAPEGYFNFRIYSEPINQPPVVNILHPLDGAIFPIEEESVSIEIDATDVDGEITSLIVHINGDSVAILDSFPYVYTWPFPGEGEYEVSAKATDEKGAETLSDIIHIVIENTTAIVPVSSEIFHVFPNPVDNILWVENVSSNKLQISVTNLFGQELLIPPFSQGAHTGFDFSNLPPGIYFVRGRMEEISTVRKVIRR